MTEQEWFECADPTPMLDFLCDHASERKIKLFEVACCRRTWHLLRDERSQVAVKVAERYADGTATRQELHDSREAAGKAAGLGHFGGDDSWGRDSFAAGTETPAKAAAWAVCSIGLTIEVSDATATAAAPTWLDRKQEWIAHAGVLRDIFGNPFHPVTLDPTWLLWNNANVPKIAQAIYDDRAFDRLLILADALEQAGCDQADILNHCRSDGSHARGCWVVDLVLGKK
jgi:hypothetical protein